MVGEDDPVALLDEVQHFAFLEAEIIVSRGVAATGDGGVAVGVAPRYGMT